jgi:hypothetical protein
VAGSSGDTEVRAAKKAEARVEWRRGEGRGGEGRGGASLDGQEGREAKVDRPKLSEGLGSHSARDGIFGCF